MRQEMRSDTMEGVRLTEFAFPQHCCCALFWAFFYGTYKERSPRCSIFLRVLKALTSIYRIQRKNVLLPRTLLSYKLARFYGYGLSSPLRILRLREYSCERMTRTLRAILPHLLPAILTLYYNRGCSRTVGLELYDTCGPIIVYTAR